VRSSSGAGLLRGASAQPASTPRIAAHAGSSPRRRLGKESKNDMWLLVLEAVAALLILVLIVWWTMFSGRRKGERNDDREDGSGR